MPFFITLADGKSGKAAVFERDESGVTERRLAGSVVAADNTSWFGRSAGACPAGKAARKHLSEGETPLKAMKSTLRDPKVLLGCNIYSVIFDYSNNAFYLASGKIPAAKGKYRKFTLFHTPRSRGK